MMKQKPQIKRELIVDEFQLTILPNGRSIFFHASRDAADEIKEFGLITQGSVEPNYYILKVNPQFDFDEVLDYMRHYNDPDNLR